ncbi:MAG: hypothetical protein LPJ89_09485 [Hymenobacteraceae bacterium]|nr:hypothetical protein [Hymenobacteraceae bacterium]MDX5395613.1 hypothetical protein [Hymenobacteraceae bacterium]MDX5443997.1 hypothetical protein [Hymenobacteraceae bacterium]MDX5511667.1 hypothetical protein [Hymenobacteraceae bacterium]
MKLTLTVRRLREHKIHGLYLLGFIISIILNNLLFKTGLSIFYGTFSLSKLFFVANIIGSYCIENSTDGALSRFVIFFGVKTILVFFAICFYRFTSSQQFKKYITEAITLFLIFDVVFMLLVPFSSLLDGGLHRYFFSSYPQYLTTFAGLPSFLAPLLWSGVLLLFLHFTKQLNLRLFSLKLLLSTFSFAWVILLILNLRPALVKVYKLLMLILA